ncbi:MAG: lipoyl(octanoyl) transferase LipB [Chloroflexota bacterium]|nr:lipoyl(octanoyl) transferase LipB [Chloroflexota bacterium]
MSNLLDQPLAGSLPAPEKPFCQVVALGTVEYGRAWDLQTDLVDAVHAGNEPNTLLLLQHPHVVTRGRLSRPEHIPVSRYELACAGVSVVETDRGGQVTYHGPGQLVAYPIVNLRDWGGPLKYVRTLEQVIIAALADLGIEAGVEPGLTGVWVDGAKIAAIGVKISRHIAHHGFAINVNPDLSKFGLIVPCGITDRPVTSISQVLGNIAARARPPLMEDFQERVAYRFGEAMGFRMGDIVRVEMDEETLD